MKNSKQTILQITFFIGLIIPSVIMGQTNAGSPKKISCTEALKNVHLIKVGMKDSEIVDLIGVPKTRLEGSWVYDFFECSPPPKVGEQIVVGLAITLKDKIITKIDYATICATGMQVSPVQKKKKRNKFRQSKGGND